MHRVVSKTTTILHLGSRSFPPRGWARMSGQAIFSNVHVVLRRRRVIQRRRAIQTELRAHLQRRVRRRVEDRPRVRSRRQVLVACHIDRVNLDRVNARRDAREVEARRRRRAVVVGGVNLVLVRARGLVAREEERSRRRRSRARGAARHHRVRHRRVDGPLDHRLGAKIASHVLVAHVNLVQAVGHGRQRDRERAVRSRGHRARDA
mmetsp:Transcript_8757/g.23553  ORF Transcript_8757/g.23553 Transcript_8757/m.23553 type:complete len:206 (+) Transcript_8757:438-1055(+)